MMKKTDIHSYTGILCGIAAVAAAVVLRWIAKESGGSVAEYISYLRSVIYIAFIIIWGVSVSRRILQRNVRRYLLAICALLLFWFVMRTLRYFFLLGETAQRYLWFLFYPALIFVPLLALFVSLSLGRPEDYRLPRWTAALYILAALLLAAVLTNDLHQLVFSFPEGVPWSGGNYGYAAGYWCVLGWQIACAAASMIIMFLKCRIPRSRTMNWLPIISFGCAVIYAVIYVTEAPFLRIVAGDLTAAECVIYIMIFESCIQCGLIRSNMHYRELFNASTIGVQITDNNNRIVLSSAEALPVPAETLRQATTAPVLLEGGLRLSGAPIHGGYVMWQEDISELTEIISELEEADEDLRGRNIVLAEEYKTRHRREALAEKNRLYNKVQAQTERQTRSLAELTEQLSHAETSQERGRLVANIAVIAAYIKRRNNLIFIAEESGMVPAVELEYCIKESLGNIQLVGAQCRLHTALREPMAFYQVAFLYDRLEAAIEAALDTLETLYVSVTERDGVPTLRLMAVCGADLSDLAYEGFAVAREDDNEWALCCVAPKGGAGA